MLFKDIANLLWVASELSNPQGLTYAAVVHGNQCVCIWSTSAAWLHNPDLGKYFFQKANQVDLNFK